MVRHGKGGVLAGTASLAAIEALPRSEHYAATKGGMISMVRPVGGIRAQRHPLLRDPAGLDRDRHDGEMVPDRRVRNKVAPRVPIRRWGGGDDFGGIAVYLLSDASRYHTGNAFVINGGHSLF